MNTGSEKAKSTIVIKRIKRGGPGAHGAAWKIAYADFVTAMMAFFLLLWLLNVTTDVQKRGIADYFEPTVASNSTSGAGGILGGMTMGSPGSQASATSDASMAIPRPSTGDLSDGSDSEDGGKTKEDDTTSDAALTRVQAKDGKELTDEELQQEVQEREEKRFESAEKALRDAVQQSPELRALANNLLIDRTPEGLRIQIVDQDRTPMFPLGSADMLDAAKKLLALVTQVIEKMPNKISITGHTDSTQYAFGARYSNWELSADRSNASRREILNDGLPPDRIFRVVGMADQEPLDKTDPSAPQNRRISIVLLHEGKEGESDQPAKN
jgi:chemotaxis protein MotB